MQAELIEPDPKATVANAIAVKINDYSFSTGWFYLPKTTQREITSSWENTISETIESETSAREIADSIISDLSSYAFTQSYVSSMREDELNTLKVSIESCISQA